jgi:transcription initiation factor IIF auxiliary subunit
MSLRIRQDETYVGQDWWTWSVWLDGTAEELADVSHVIYTLHPSFAPPVVTVKNRSKGFRLQSEGWGTFTMHLDIVQRDKTITRRKHDLKLHYPEESRARSAPEKSAAPRFYVSSTASDAGTAHEIKASLLEHGAQIVSNEDSSAGQPPSRALEDRMTKSKGAIFVMSSQPSVWMNREIEAARRHKVPITAVLVGATSPLPRSIADLTTVRIKDASEIEKVFKKMRPAFSSSASRKARRTAPAKGAQGKGAAPRSAPKKG